MMERVIPVSFQRVGGCCEPIASGNEGHSRTVFLNKVRNTDLAALYGLGLFEPKRGIFHAIKVVPRVYARPCREDEFF